MSSTRGNIFLIVTAHPDDECMFFLPTIKYCQSIGGASVWVLCLTTGNYDGLGPTRVQELQDACYNVIGVDKVIVINDEMSSEKDSNAIIRDHPRQKWPIERAVDIIDKVIRAELGKMVSDENRDSAELRRNKIAITLVTFDDYGVSGHINHRDTFRAVQSLYRKQREKLTLCDSNHKEYQNNSNYDELGYEVDDFWTLRSEHNLFYKYVPLYSWILLLLSYLGLISRPLTSLNSELVVRIFEPRLSWQAMAAHHSQFVWYRRLFVVFSCYTYVNVINRDGKPDSDKKDK